MSFSDPTHFAPLINANATEPKGATFSHLGAGGYLTYPVLQGVSLYASGLAEQKLNSGDTAFDQGNYSGSAGVSVLNEKDLFRFGLNHSLLYIENKRFRATTGISGEWQHQLDQD